MLANNAGQGMDVLVVEDSAMQAMALRLSLLKKEFSVRIATNGIEAIEMMKVQKPTLVISDIEMPEMDGYTLCATIKADRTLRDVPVILLTALSEPDDILKGLEVKADNYLTKPWDEDLLYTRVQKILINRALPDSREDRRGVAVIRSRRRHNVAADRDQIINLLMSSIDNARHKDEKMSARVEELEKIQQELLQQIEVLQRENHELRSKPT